MCADVINSNRWFESGQVAMRLGGDPPYNIIEGIEVYQNAIGEARADRMEKERRRAQANRNTSKGGVKHGK